MLDTYSDNSDILLISTLAYEKNNLGKFALIFSTRLGKNYKIFRGLIILMFELLTLIFVGLLLYICY